MEHQEIIREDGKGSRSVFRIAVPVWGMSQPKAPTPQAAEPTREDFEQLLKSALSAEELRKTGLGADERRQLAIARRIRDALYGQPDYA